MGLRGIRILVSQIVLLALLGACAPATAAPPSGGGAPTAAVAAATAAPLLAGIGGGSCANPYYPTPSGSNWSYSSTGSNRGPYTYTRAISAVTATGFTAHEEFSTGVKYDFQWKCDGGNLAALDAGPSSFGMTTSSAKMSSTSVTVDGYDIPGTFTAGESWSDKLTVTGDVTSGGKKVTSEIATQSSCNAIDTESVTVPAGTFPAYKVTCSKTVTVSSIIAGKSTQLATNHEEITSWYAKGVGFVKSAATGGSNNETIVLTAYKMG